VIGALNLEKGFVSKVLGSFNLEKGL
jgi:hypothetical protein